MGTVGQASRRALSFGFISLTVLAGMGAGFTGSADQGATFDFGRSKARIAAFEAAFFPNYDDGICPYYGRAWRDGFAKQETYRDSGVSVWRHYRESLARSGITPERLDCTLYAKEVLKAGLSPRDYRRLWAEHHKIWGDDGFSGWSVGYLLTEKLGWRAYAVIHPEAPDFNYYVSHFESRREYPVWRQPNIPIEKYFISGRDDREIEALLSQHPFGWGFSEGGIHTWITSGVNLKECHYDKGPSPRYDMPESHALFQAGNLRVNPLFKTTRFVKFTDYSVHLIVFPPERVTAPRRGGE